MEHIDFVDSDIYYGLLPIGIQFDEADKLFNEWFEVNKKSYTTNGSTYDYDSAFKDFVKEL